MNIPKNIRIKNISKLTLLARENISSAHVVINMVILISIPVGVLFSVIKNIMKVPMSIAVTLIFIFRRIGS